MRPRRDCPQRFGYSQSTIAVAVPIDANLLSRRLNHVLDRKFNKAIRAFWRRMADGIAQNDGARSASNRGGVKPLDGLSVRSNRVFRHVHRRQIVANRELHRVFCRALQMIDCPVFDKTPDRT